MVPLPGLPEAAGRANHQAEEALRHLLAVRRADVHSRAGGHRGIWKARRAGFKSGRVDASRPTGATLQAEVSGLHKVLLGKPGIGGDESVQRESIGLSLPGEELPGRRSDRRATMTKKVASFFRSALPSNCTLAKPTEI